MVVETPTDRTCAMRELVSGSLLMAIKKLFILCVISLSLLHAKKTHTGAGLTSLDTEGGWNRSHQCISHIAVREVAYLPWARTYGLYCMGQEI